LSDVIKLLPDAVANQIAAGEVVQRPASAIKELLENSLDAGATSIRLIIKDGGSALMQVIDNGCGMSETDARMCWERHATSKIRAANDLFALSTFGFRGEALASIGAVAQVEMKTRRAEDDAATFIRIEGSKVIEQTLTAAPVGTSIAIKNLFYNIPARRNFLKSASVETKHIIEEFQRQSMAHPQIGFSMFNNNAEVYELKPTTLKQRIADVLGNKKENELLQIEENTEIVSITGYMGIPSLCRRTRGEQYLYVNGRFIRSAYLNHAIQSAYEGLAEQGTFPLFVVFMQIDPARVDVNVHPTKTEVKFDDEKHIYNILKAAARKTIGQHIVQPDAELFEGLGGLEDFLNKPIGSFPVIPSHEHRQAGSNPGSYNPFTQDRQEYRRNNQQDWQKILGSVELTRHAESGINTDFVSKSTAELIPDATDLQIEELFQLGNAYIAVKIRGELYVVDRRAAHVKVLYHKFLRNLELQKGYSQQLLFPGTVELNPALIHMALEMLDDLKSLGFDVSHFGGNTLMINGVPAEVNRGDEGKVLETLLEEFEETKGHVNNRKHDILALSMSRQAALRSNDNLDKESLKALVEQLFATPGHYFGPDGKPVIIKFGTEFLFELFRTQK
jgi:DNA mismatch repair protein MutL